MDTQSESVLDYPPSYCQEVQIESVVIAQYIDNDLESSSNMCEGNADDVECFENKDYEVQSLDQENAAEVYEGVKPVALRAIDFVLNESSEKHDALKSEDIAEVWETGDSREEAPVGQEDNRILEDAMEDEADHIKMELTEENSSDKSCHNSTSAGVKTSCLAKPPKRGQGQPTKDTQNKIELCEEKTEEGSTADSCASLDR